MLDSVTENTFFVDMEGDLKSVGCISRSGSSPAPGTRRETPLTVGFFGI